MNYFSSCFRFMITAVIVCIFAAVIAFAQQPTIAIAGEDNSDEIAGKIVELLKNNYVFPETAKRIESALLENIKQGSYRSIGDPEDLALQLTRDLQKISSDLHLRVNYSADVLPPDPVNMFEPTEEEIEPIRRGQERENFGVRKVEVLKGNIGLIRFDYFTNPEWAGNVYTSALNYVSGTNALIIDLRNNGGSMNENAIPFICSYFFEKPVHLNDIYWRPQNFTKQFWTYAVVPGKRYLNKPIYVLTSNRTFSGAEEIAYDLKNLKRAKIVGETTGGGAHGGGTKRINDHFSIWIPLGRAINPVTNTNWEGTGVSPDIQIASNKALYQTLLLILSEFQKSTQDKQALSELLNYRSEIEKKLLEFKTYTFRLKGFEDARSVHLAGDFNSWSRRTIKMKNDADGWFAEYEVEPGRYGYRFLVDGKWINDPANPETEISGGRSNSVITIN
ncbi:MAG: S41 family peptidase [Pyrinomonadaceae bacterium]